MNKLFIPLAVFAVIGGFLFVGLGMNPREIPSPLIDKPAPPFGLARLDEPGKTFGLADMKGQVWLLNVWASWCVACRTEHPVLVELAKRNIVPIVGLNYKDKPEEAKAWLANLGDPYSVSVMDRDGRVGIDFGVYGVPETFLIDSSGTIRYKHIGPVTEDVLAKKMLPIIYELQKS